MKVSVVMASYLNFPNRQNLENKFKRAVKSFLNQTYDNKELIIVSDGCQKTNQIYNENWKDINNVKLFPSQKQQMYSGGIRSIGVKMAEGDIITYLDNDDVLGKTHIETIVNQFDIEKYDFVYYDDYLVLNPEFTKFQKRYVETRFGSIGTSSITHRNFHKNPLNNIVDWRFHNGYGHDYTYMMSMITAGAKFMKLKNPPQYLVAHYGGADF